ncbi:MAG: hypothetical protein M0C28_03905 [Candidatus Moduliflexus flocculans]|nr:hypothetical protein [Candidatus Moduliflexus flocculans]
MKMFFAFSLLAIAVGCLGPLRPGRRISAERRTKEIGVRKVLGASAPAIAGLLSREFTKWVVIANLIAWPAAYFAMRRNGSRASPTGCPIGIVPFVLSAALALADRPAHGQLPGRARGRLRPGQVSPLRIAISFRRTSAGFVRAARKACPITVS